MKLSFNLQSYKVPVITCAIGYIIFQKPIPLPACRRCASPRTQPICRWVDRWIRQSDGAFGI